VPHDRNRVSGAREPRIRLKENGAGGAGASVSLLPHRPAVQLVRQAVFFDKQLERLVLWDILPGYGHLPLDVGNRPDCPFR